MWAAEAAGADVLIDLVQPKFPNRLGTRAVSRIAGQRRATTQGILAAIESLPADDRPLLFSVSGADDLEPDEAGVVSHSSTLRADPYGFSSIGVPVHRLIEDSGV